MRFLAQSTVQLVRYAQQLSWVKVKIFNDLKTLKTQIKMLSLIQALKYRLAVKMSGVIQIGSDILKIMLRRNMISLAQKSILLTRTVGKCWAVMH